MDEKNPGFSDELAPIDKTVFDQLGKVHHIREKQFIRKMTNPTSSFWSRFFKEKEGK